ncbi:MAG: hypothetical protein ACLGIM_17585 [Alphaproteobacteria bacterium]|jgi:ABC-type antimicrobial peptide transport system permease subunit
MWSFVKSVLFGAVAGAAPVLVFTFALAINSLPEGLKGGGSLFLSVWLAILPLVISIPLVFGASVIVGLPLTTLLKRRRRESEFAYISVGAAVGFALPIVILLLIAAPAGYWTALLGAFGGAITGKTWWVSAREPHVSYPD